LIDATIDGPGMVIAFNVKFLREALEVIKTPNLALETNDHKSPARVQPVGDDSFLHVIMPMHLG
jgi:DNA polymerase-3 subunit beta